jgi:hypothetical protein
VRRNLAGALAEAEEIAVAFCSGDVSRSATAFKNIWRRELGFIT